MQKFLKICLLMLKKLKKHDLVTVRAFLFLFCLPPLPLRWSAILPHLFTRTQLRSENGVLAEFDSVQFAFFIRNSSISYACLESHKGIQKFQKYVKGKVRA